LSVVGAFAAGVGGAYVEVGEFDRSLMILNQTNASVNANLYQVQKSGTGVLTVDPAGNVGIGTSSPATILEVSQATPVVRLQASAANAFHGIEYRQSTGVDVELKQLPATGEFRISSGRSAAWGGFTSFYIDTVERFRMTANGLTFNGDSAAANALDDYEEGTWTMGVSFGGAAVGVTYGANTGKYTKIGRQVTATGYIELSSKGSSTGAATITGLPFTIPSGTSSFVPATLWLKTITFANQYQGYGAISDTSIVLGELTILGVFTALTDADFANSSEIMVSFTYFV